MQDIFILSIENITKTRKRMNNTINGKCSCCGGCCGRFLPLTDKDIARVKYQVEVRKLKPQRPEIIIGEDLTCPFLTKDKKCIIYNHRPYICRLFKCDKHGEMTQDEAKILRHATPIDMWAFFS